jgi:hypothetical protein
MEWAAHLFTVPRFLNPLDAEISALLATLDPQRGGGRLGGVRPGARTETEDRSKDVGSAVTPGWLTGDLPEPRPVRRGRCR